MLCGSQMAIRTAINEIKEKTGADMIHEHTIQLCLPGQVHPQPPPTHTLLAHFSAPPRNCGSPTEIHPRLPVSRLLN
jgi:hypothetical protein